MDVKNLFDLQVKEKCLLVCECIYTLALILPRFFLRFVFTVPKLGGFIFLKYFAFNNPSSRLFSISSVFIEIVLVEILL